MKSFLKNLGFSSHVSVKMNKWMNIKINQFQFHLDWSNIFMTNFFGIISFHGILLWGMGEENFSCVFQ